MIIFSGSRSTDLSWEVAKEFKTELGKAEYKKFPDGEIYFRSLTKVAGKECLIVQSIKSSEDLVELMLMADCLKDNNALQVHVVTPYLAYMRQDKRFNGGEALSAKTVLKILEELSDSMTTVNCHFLDNEGPAIYNNINFHNLDGIPAILDYMKSKVTDPIIIAPDKGSLSFAKKAAEIMNCDFNHIEKTRISGTEVRMKAKDMDVKGKDVIILDDIISTGGTILEACRLLKGWRPASINVGCVHGIFLNGIEQFQGYVDRMVSTNSLNSSLSKVSLAKTIADHYK